jgi:hypothetical protein
MSNAVLKGNASGTGTVTLETPDTNSDRTISLPDADGTMLYANTSGNVGIGTSSPSGLLTAYKNVNSATVFANKSDYQIVIDVDGAHTGEYVGGLAFGDQAVSTVQAAILAVDTGGSAATALAFATGNTAGIVERMRIDSAGILMVGTSATRGAGGLTVEPNNSGGSGTASATVTWNRNTTTNTSTAARFENAANLVGSITFSNTATSYVTSSDYRLKENIAPMTGALNKVAQLKPVTYKWKVDGSASQGFIAHELAEVVPDCVTGEKDAVDAEGNPVYQGIDTSFLVATLTAAIQELKAELDATKAEVAALKGAE